MQLDSTYKFETPEGVELELRLAGLLPRMLAWILDFIIRLGLFIVISFVSSFFGVAGKGLLLISWFIIEWFYPVLFEVYKGATPGKRALKLYVCHDDGTPIGWGASLTRNLLRVIDFLPFFYALGGLVAIFNSEFKRIGDYVAGTLVVYKEPGLIVYKGEEIGAEALPVQLSLSEQRAVLAFRERAGSLSPARKEELAGHLAHTMGWPEVTDEQYYEGYYTKKIRAYASTIASGRSAEASSSLFFGHSSKPASARSDNLKASKPAQSDQTSEVSE